MASNDPPPPPPPPTKYTNLADPQNPCRLETSDNPGTILVTDLVHVENFSTWSRSLQRALRAKNKIGFLNGTLSKPSNPADPLVDLWDRCNDMVVSWIQNSISLPLRSSLAFVDDAHDIWTELQERFSPQNGPRIYELKKTLVNLSQENDIVNGYYGKLKSLWDELSIHDPLHVCSCGSTKTLSDRYQRDCVIQFLMGLNDSYSNVRDQIMLIDPLPSVTKVFSYIKQQERHRMVTSSIPHPDSITLVSRKPSPNPPSNSGNKDKPYCTHCKITGHTLQTCFKSGNAVAPVCTHYEMTCHTMERCYKLHGYPPGHKMHKPRGNAVSFDSPVSCNQPDSSNFLTKE
ncbi:uncharacterized protein LOC121255189 [Juglans microcarpa x Juglans regia]|uniref:uncharacterized protein LOC121255189 n=1 Tax=Juglans microcarpa x Juglans regia TaxID=2249226 RepID=UPI001B7DA4D9|nr:uncharacterized protein LOC121255189 [Juglans microcarpa x Juglans regia]